MTRELICKTIELTRANRLSGAARATTALRAAVLDRENDAPALLVLPAMGTAAGYYDPFVAALGERGLHAASVDLRGIGASSVRADRGHDFGYDTLVSDALDAADALRDLVPRAREVVLVGHSLGGHVALLVLARTASKAAGEESPSRVALVAAGSPFHRVLGGPVASAGIFAFAHLARATGTALGYFPGRRLGFGGREARTLIHEWSRFVRKGALDLDAWSAPSSPESLLANVRPRLLAVGVEGDVLAPPASVDALLAKVPLATVARATVESRAFTRQGGRAVHHAWARHPKDVASRLSAWLTS